MHQIHKNASLKQEGGHVDSIVIVDTKNIRYCLQPKHDNSNPIR